VPLGLIGVGWGGGFWLAPHPEILSQTFLRIWPCLV
jgi:hypothetical protein